MNGQDVATTLISDSNLSSGGIGFTSWDPSINSQIVINNLQVAPLTADDITVPLPAPQGGSSGLAASSIHLTLPYSETNFSNDPDWEKSWGTMSVDPSNFLDIGANASTTGGGVSLIGLGAWTNYTFSTIFTWVKGQTVSLIARSSDNRDDLYCEFDNDGGIDVYRLSGGQKVSLGTGSAPNFSIAHDRPSIYSGQW